MISEVTYKSFAQSGLETGKKYEVVEMRDSEPYPIVIIRENSCTTVTCNAGDFYEKDEICKAVRG